MKALIVTLLFPVLLKSCEGIPEQSGQAPRTNNPVPPPSGGGGGGSTPATPTDVPIDGGLSILLLGGAAYGIRKYRNKKESSVE